MENDSFAQLRTLAGIEIVEILSTTAAGVSIRSLAGRTMIDWYTLRRAAAQQDTWLAGICGDILRRAREHAAALDAGRQPLPDGCGLGEPLMERRWEGPGVQGPLGDASESTRKRLEHHAEHELGVMKSRAQAEMRLVLLDPDQTADARADRDTARRIAHEIDRARGT